MEYRQVKVRGHFLHDKELYMGPRSFISNNSNTSKGGVFSSQNPGSGFLVITPFKLEDRECVLFFLIFYAYAKLNAAYNSEHAYIWCLREFVWHY